MASQIDEKRDGMMLADNAAWHGFGTVVKGAQNPFAALRLAGMEDTIEASESLTGGFADGTALVAPSHKVLRRKGTEDIMGIVGKDYQIFQNYDGAELAYSFAKEGGDGVAIEVAGTLFGYRKAFMLARGASVDIGGKGDISNLYAFISWGHDGNTPISICPTNVRVVCNNTWQAALRGAKGSRYTIRHTAKAAERIESVRDAVRRWFNDAGKGEVQANLLAAKAVNREWIMGYWAEIVTAQYGKVEQNPKNGHEQRRKDRATGFLQHAAQAFDAESAKFGATAWIAANAATSALQHYRALDQRGTAEERAADAWDGDTAEATADAFAGALARI